MSETTTDLKAKLARISVLRRELDKMKPLKDELDELKFEIQLEMQQSQSKRTDAFAGVYAIRQVRTSIKVDDQEAVSQWLTDNMFDDTEYWKLDETRIKALAESKLKEDGEIIPGLSAEESEYISIREVKGK